MATKKKATKKAAKKSKRTVPATKKAAKKQVKKPASKASAPAKAAQKPAAKASKRQNAGLHIAPKSASRASASTKKAPPASKKPPARAGSSRQSSARTASRAAGAPVRERPSRPEYLESDDDRPGLGPGSGGQSGDIQGLSDREVDDSESVDELAEEGQGWEAAAVMGVEEGDSPNEVRTHEVPEDDVPEEYLNDGDTDADEDR